MLVWMAALGMVLLLKFSTKLRYYSQHPHVWLDFFRVNLLFSSYSNWNRTELRSLRFCLVLFFFLIRRHTIWCGDWPIKTYRIAELRENFGRDYGIKEPVLGLGWSSC